MNTRNQNQLKLTFVGRAMSASKSIASVLLLTLGACSGAPFEAVPRIAPNQAGAASVEVTAPQAGGPSFGGTPAISLAGGAIGGKGGDSSIGGSPLAGSAGDNGGTGGAGGVGPSTSSAGEGGVSSFSCLAEYQNLDCARVCTQSGTDCGLVIACYIKTNQINRGPANPLDPCSNFTQDGTAIAQRAWLACCPH